MRKEDCEKIISEFRLNRGGMLIGNIVYRPITKDSYDDDEPPLKGNLVHRDFEVIKCEVVDLDVHEYVGSETGGAWPITFNTTLTLKPLEDLPDWYNPDYFDEDFTLAVDPLIFESREGCIYYMEL